MDMQKEYTSNKLKNRLEHSVNKLIDGNLITRIFGMGGHNENVEWFPSIQLVLRGRERQQIKNGATGAVSKKKQVQNRDRELTVPELYYPTINAIGEVNKKNIVNCLFLLK